MSESDQSMSMNSLMEAIYGDHHHTQYVSEIEEEEQNYTQQLSQFMQSLINHLKQLCMTHGAVQNAQRILNPWIRDAKVNIRNPKASLQGFLKSFLRLFQQETNKINKYGQKKLKYLTQTVSKQIFTQIMRMSCDLKFQSVNRANSAKNNQKKNNNVTILVHSIDRIFGREQSTLFRILKKCYQQSIKKEQNFVNNLENSIKKLDKIYQKSRNLKLWKAMTLWRIKNIEIQQEETVTLCTLTKHFYSSILPSIVNTWRERPSSSTSVIVQQLIILFKDLPTNAEGTQVQFIGNPCFCNNSLDYSAISSYRSSVSQISSISIGEYLKNEQIKFDNNSKFLAIPMIVGDEQIGLVKISWQYQLPITLFNKIIKLTETLKQIIQGFSKISTRLGYYISEYQNNSWHEQLYTLCLRQEPLQLKSLQMILDAANIKYLQIYHDRNVPDACIKYGKQNAAPIPQNIYQLIWEKLLSEQSFKLDREDKNYEIAKLDQEGFCRYSLEQEQIPSDHENKTKNSVLQCIVPLLTKNFGKIGCQSCKIEVKELKLHEQQKLKEENQVTKPVVKNYNFESLMNIKDAKNIQQAQQSVMNLIKNYFPQQKVFAKMFYNVEDCKNMYAYRSKKDYRSKKEGRPTIQMTQIHKGLANENVCSIQVNQQNKNLRQLSKILQQGALFEQPEIYLYSNEKSKPMKVIPKKLGRKLLILFSTYDQIQQEQVKQILDIAGSELQKNDNIFQKQDLYAWKSDVLMKNKSVLQFDNKIEADQLQRICQLSFVTAVEKVCGSLTFVKKINLWRTCTNTIIDLISDSKIDIKKLPKCLLDKEPIRSHYSVSGDHRVLKSSLNFGQKLQQQLTYIPNFGEEQHKIAYAQAACSDIPDSSQFSDSRYEQICQFLRSHSKTQQLQYQFICVPISHMNRSYITIVYFDKNTSMSNLCFQATTKYLQRIINQIIERKVLTAKNNSLLKLNSYCKQKGGLLQNRFNRIRKIIHIFKNIRDFKQEQKRKLSMAVCNMQQKSQFRMKRTGFILMKKNSLFVKDAYIGGCDYAISKIMKIFFITPFVQSLNRMKDRRVGTQKLVDSLAKILNNLSVASRTTNRVFFTKIQQSYFIKSQSKHINRTNSLQIISHILTIIQKRNKTHYFTKTLENSLSLKRSLIILQQQFKLIDPKSMKSAVNFLQGRLNLMINQHYRSSIMINVYNFGFVNLEQSKVNKNGVVFVRNSSFAMEFGNGDTGMEFQGLNKLVEPILYEILPNWEVSYRKNQNFRLKILYQVIEKVRCKALSRIFSLEKSIKFKDLIEQNKRLQKDVMHETSALAELKQNWNPNTNLQRRQKHRKQITELKQNINTIHNQLDKISVEGKIKSKTNAAYRMLLIMSQNQDKKTRKYQKNDYESQLKDIKSSIKEERVRYICQNLPLWAASIKSIIKRNQRTNIQYFFQAFTQIHL